MTAALLLKMHQTEHDVQVSQVHNVSKEMQSFILPAPFQIMDR